MPIENLSNTAQSDDDARIPEDPELREWFAGFVVDTEPIPPFPRPKAGETLVVQPSYDFSLDFEPDEATASGFRGNLILRLPDGGTLVLEDILTVGCVDLGPHVITTPSGTTTLKEYLAEHAPDVGFFHPPHHGRPWMDNGGGVGEYRGFSGRLMRGVEPESAAPSPGLPALEGATAPSPATLEPMGDQALHISLLVGV